MENYVCEIISHTFKVSYFSLRLTLNEKIMFSMESNKAIIPVAGQEIPGLSKKKKKMKAIKYFCFKKKLFKSEPSKVLKLGTRGQLGQITPVRS